ncbi:Protein TRI1 [Cocos nucifera]|uniref:Protein TRI1 n=1 Tax=Cocos nucifera TaxID=13894 RepID=A0A8K0IE80_COCNU|nr:Protein TRI1 [Cocos nucifera]
MASMLAVGSLSAFVVAAPPLTKPSRQPILTAGGLPLARRAATVDVRASASSKPAPSAGTRQPRGITKPKPVSPAMQAIVGVPEIPRTQALKRIWAYIKEHNLQDPENKRIIVCDEKLRNLFGGKERVGFLEISGLLNPHFGK